MINLGLQLSNFNWPKDQVKETDQIRKNLWQFADWLSHERYWIQDYDN
jgi:hypothetical protein